MTPMPRPTFTTRLTGAITATALAVASLSVHATQVDAGLALALDGIWQQQRAAVSVLTSSFNAADDSDPVRYETDIKKAPTYTNVDGENARIDYLRKQYPINESPWGPLPQLDIAKTQLLEVNLPERRYLVVSAPGAGLYSVTDWQRFGFLHVLDVTNRSRVIHYPLVAEAGLREKVLGRLPDSPVLHYARLVPSRWASNTKVNAYEVLLYALKPKGPERVVAEDGRNLSYSISRVYEDSPWTLQRVDTTPVALARDAAGRAFSSPAMKGALGPPPTVTSVAENSPTPAAATMTVPQPAVGTSGASIQPAPAHAKTTDDGTLARAKANANANAKDAAKDAASDAAKDAAKKSAGEVIKKKPLSGW